MTGDWDAMSGYVTLDVGGGKRLAMDRVWLEKYGAEAVLRSLDAEQRAAFLERIPVYQDGRQIGTLSAGYHPLIYRPRNYFYDPRPNDFRRSDRGWEASPMLGQGDLDAIPDFRWDGEGEEAKRAAREAEFNAVLLGAIRSSSRDRNGNRQDTAEWLGPKDEGANSSIPSSSDPSERNT